VQSEGDVTSTWSFESNTGWDRRHCLLY
jgi:hypothetical protein